jgi:transcriptional regulatory protein RtcR
MKRRQVVLGFLGTQLDAGGGPRRWERWRPTVDLCARDDFAVDRLVLFADPAYARLRAEVTADIASVSPETRVEPAPLGIADPWDFEEVFAKLLDFARAFAWDAEREDYFVHITTGTHVAQICLFLLTEARYLPGRLLQTSPPRRGAGKDPGRMSIVDLDLSRYDRIAARFRMEHAAAQSRLKAGIATRSVAYNRMIERIEEVAIASSAPILLLGPTGAGKSQLARRVFELKKERKKLAGPFVEVNCATLRGDAAMSALFGHVRGAFTGAVGPREGHLCRADGGALFLDEIGELGADEQAMLLRAVEEKVFYPMGSDREVRSQFELLCGTNRDLPRLVAEGRFRRDLLARIDLWTFRLPSLTERLEDLEPNLDFELDLTSRALGRRVTMSREARDRYLAFASSPEASWPGNFRDLDASVTRMATLAPGGRITDHVVDEEVERLRRAFAGGGGGGADGGLVDRVLGPGRSAALDRFDRAQLEEVLTVCARAPSLSAAGRELFAESRKSRSKTNDADRLRKYLGRFGLSYVAVRGALSFTPGLGRGDDSGA